MSKRSTEPETIEKLETWQICEELSRISKIISIVLMDADEIQKMKEQESL